MSLQALGIEHKQVAETLAATIKINLKSRQDLPAILNELAQHISQEHIAGPPFCVIQFVTSIQDGLDAEIGFPVSRAIETGEIKTRLLPPIEVLSLTHTGPLQELRASHKTLYGSAAAQGLISDEFVREVYLDWEHDEWKVEVQFVLHNWNKLFAANLERVLGQEARRQVLQGVEEPGIESVLDERFRWAKEMMERLDRAASEDQKYDIVSGCAHIFPQPQIDKLRAVYIDARAKTDNPLDAIDAVIEFMGQDPGWGEKPLRNGKVIYSAKAPRDPQAYEKAQTEAERKSAYCFCPIVRNRMEQGMPTTFCYCGSGWYRRQWEGATGKAVKITIVKSVLNGDDKCQFAIHLPDEL